MVGAVRSERCKGHKLGTKIYRTNGRSTTSHLVGGQPIRKVGTIDIALELNKPEQDAWFRGLRRGVIPC